MATPSQFDLFSSLPPELRLRIWSYSLPGPRLVSLCYTPASERERVGHRVLEGRYTSSTPIPANLHTSREARTYALKHYRLSFAALPHGPPTIFFDQKTDVLYFQPRDRHLVPGSGAHLLEALAIMSSADLAAVNRLAVHESLLAGTVRGTMRASVAVELRTYLRRRCGGVTEVAVVMDEGQRGDWDDAREWVVDVLGWGLGERRLDDSAGVAAAPMPKRLVGGLESDLRSAVEAESELMAPMWSVRRFPSCGDGARLAAEQCRARQREKLAKIEKVVVPRRKAVVKGDKAFWMGGELPFWHCAA